MDPSRGDWAATATGRAFFLLTPDPREVVFEDILYPLSRLPRYNGQTVFDDLGYSVGQHSVLVSLLVEALGGMREEQLCGLFHDAHEAYLGDWIRPLKRALKSLCPEAAAALEELVHRCQLAISERFRIVYPLPDIVKQADNFALILERRDFLVPSPHEWIEEAIKPPPWPEMRAWDERTTRREFVGRLKQIAPAFPATLPIV